MLNLTKISTRNKYLLTCLIPLFVLILMCIPPIITQKYGKIIQLEGMVSPGKDTFRGKVLYLNYKISITSKDKLDPSLYKKAEKYTTGQIEAYAILNKKDDYYDLSRITANKPNSNEIYLKCQVPIYVLEKDYQNADEKIQEIYINYPLDKYFTSSSNIIEKDYYNNLEKNPSYMGNYSYIIKLKVYKGSSQVVDILKK